MKFEKLLPGKIIREEFNLRITDDPAKHEIGYKNIKVKYDDIRSEFNTESPKDSFSFSGTALLYDTQNETYENVGTFIVEYDVKHPYSSDDNDCTLITYNSISNNDYWLSLVYNCFKKRDQNA